MKTKLITPIIGLLLLTIPLLTTTTATEPTGAVLELEIFTGFNTGAKIRNIGDTDALLVNYNLSITGGFLQPINYTTKGGIGSLPVYNDAVELVITIPKTYTQGFGKVTITATADSLFTSPITKQTDALLLFFIIIPLQ